MNGELISVIIPVYGVEPYLEKCVQSVLAQTYRDLEVILVDDGSPDGCPAMCDAFAARDGRVLVIHKENGGQGSARNRGLDIARGAYIGFVDSDDYIVPDMYEKLYAALTQAGADLAICDFAFVDGEGNILESSRPVRQGVVTREQLFDCLETVSLGQYSSPCLRLCRRELFDGLRFEEDMLYEDEMISHLLYARCERGVIIADKLYCYYQRTGSTVHRPVSVRRLDAVRALMARYDYYVQHDCRRPAPRVLRYAYITLWEVLHAVDVWQQRDVLRPYVRRVSEALLRRGNIRGLWVRLWFRMALLRYRIADRGERKDGPC